MSDERYAGRIPAWMLKQRQGLPLDVKIEKSLRRIEAWHDHWRSQIYVAFSGGLCSTVLLHLVRSAYPKCPAVFADTGLEFPENRELVRATENVVTVRPSMSFRAVIEKHGWPVVSKRTSGYIHQVVVNRKLHPGEWTTLQRLRLTGFKKNGEFSKMSKIPKCWQYLCDAPFKVSDGCCHVMKTGPAFAFQKRSGSFPLLGTRADEGRGRELIYQRFGCNAYSTKWPRSTPIAFWKKRDVWAYVKMHGLRYSAVYNMGYERTGCMFCAFGAHMERRPNRFERMAKTHPKQYRYCMEKLGLRKVLEYCGIPAGKRS